MPGVSQGAFWGLIVGLVIGMIRFIMEFAFTIPACGGKSHSATAAVRNLNVNKEASRPKTLESI